MDISDKINLPPVVKVSLRSEVDFYGASSVIARQLILKKTPLSSATWRHGWTFYPLKYVCQLVWTDNDAQIHLLSTEREVRFLKENHIDNVVAVGNPFIYADTPGVPRQKKSLLVMPPQTFKNSSNGMNEVEYVEYIKSISRDFSSVVFCLRQDSISKEKWCPALQDAGLDWVTGASPDDSNSLIRMQKIFRSFDYMTTCVIGSHLVYAAYCGCKVSIAGDYVGYSRSDLFDHDYYEKFPEILDFNLKIYSEDFVRGEFSFLFVDPINANEKVDWASEQVGLKYKKSVEELKELLGWTLFGQLRACLWFVQKLIKKIVSRATNYHI